MCLAGAIIPIPAEAKPPKRLLLKKPKKQSKTTRVKAVARERVGEPKPVRVIVDKRLRETPKHKKNIEADV